MIAKGDDLIYCNGYGIMNLEKKEKVNCDSKFYFASASNQFTAMDILKLIDQGKLIFNTTLQEILLKFPNYGKQIIIQQLLTHQSGLHEINNINNDKSEKLMTDNDRLKALVASMNRVGYAILNMDRIENALKLKEQFPESSNAYDSLAETYLKNSNKQLAIKNYETSIKLNPKNSNAKSILKDLKNK